MSDGCKPRLFLPAALLELGTAAKMLWVYFNLKGALVTSQRDLSVSLGLTQHTIGQNLIRLGDVGFIRYKPAQSRSEKSKIKAVKPMFKPLLDSFPTLLREADASSKLLYLWLLPQGNVSYTPKEIAAYLGTTEKTAAKARQELESLGVIAYKQYPVAKQSGLYRVLKPRELQTQVKGDNPLALPEVMLSKGAELKLYWYISHKGETFSHQHTLAAILDVPQSAMSNAVNRLLEQGLIERIRKNGEDLLITTREHSSNKRTPRDLIPSKLKGEANAVQFLYMWLRGQGEVSFSYSEMVELVRIRSQSLMVSVKRLEQLGLLKVYKKPTPHRKGRLKAL